MSSSGSSVATSIKWKFNKKSPSKPSGGLLLLGRTKKVTSAPKPVNLPSRNAESKRAPPVKSTVWGQASAVKTAQTPDLGSLQQQQQQQELRLSQRGRAQASERSIRAPVDRASLPTHPMPRVQAANPSLTASSSSLPPSPSSTPGQGDANPSDLNALTSASASSEDVSSYTPRPQVLSSRSPILHGKPSRPVQLQLLTKESAQEADEGASEQARGNRRPVRTFPASASSNAWKHGQETQEPVDPESVQYPGMHVQPRDRGENNTDDPNTHSEYENRTPQRHVQEGQGQPEQQQEQLWYDKLDQRPAPVEPPVAAIYADEFLSRSGKPMPSGKYSSGKGGGGRGGSRGGDRGGKHQKKRQNSSSKRRGGKSGVRGGQSRTEPALPPQQLLQQQQQHVQQEQVQQQQQQQPAPAAAVADPVYMPRKWVDEQPEYQQPKHQPIQQQKKPLLSSQFASPQQREWTATATQGSLQPPSSSSSITAEFSTAKSGLNDIFGGDFGGGQPFRSMYGGFSAFDEGLSLQNNAPSGGLARGGDGGLWSGEPAPSGVARERTASERKSTKLLAKHAKEFVPFSEMTAQDMQQQPLIRQPVQPMRAVYAEPVQHAYPSATSGGGYGGYNGGFKSSLISGATEFVSREEFHDLAAGPRAIISHAPHAAPYAASAALVNASVHNPAGVASAPVLEGNVQRASGAQASVNARGRGRGRGRGGNGRGRGRDKSAHGNKNKAVQQQQSGSRGGRGGKSRPRKKKANGDAKQAAVISSPSTKAASSVSSSQPVDAPRTKKKKKPRHKKNKESAAKKTNANNNNNAPSSAATAAPSQ